MKLYGRWYEADKGKHFVLTEKGKTECASFHGKTVGEPTSDEDTRAVDWSVDQGFEIEVPIPDWIVKDGYKVVYQYNGYELSAGNPIIFPELELAEKYMEKYRKNPWMHEELYICKAVYEGRALKDCTEYNGKRVYNKDWYYGTDALNVGDLVEESIVSDLMNCLPPACMRSDCCQLGEPSSNRIDDAGKGHTTYETFKKVAENIWMYCGDCFRGENIQRGTKPYYI